MTIMDVLSIFSLFVGIVSIILALYAMASARRSEERSKVNFENTQEMIRKFYDGTKELLSEIDKKTSVTEKVITSNQEQLMTTMTNIVNETVIPKKQDMGEQLGMMFFQQLFSDPKGASGMMEALKPLMQMVNEEKNRKI